MRPQVVTTISSSWGWSWALRKGCRKSLPVSVVLNSLLVYSPLKRGAAFWQGKHAVLIWRQQQINLKKKKPSGVTSRRAARKVEKKINKHPLSSGSCRFPCALEGLLQSPTAEAWVRATLKMRASWALSRGWPHDIHFSLIISAIGADSCCAPKPHKVPC